MHYTAGADAGRPPILLVPSLINRSYIWDLRHGDSFVEHLLGAGYDVLCLDWGQPDARDAHNTMSTYRRLHDRRRCRRDTPVRVGADRHRTLLRRSDRPAVGGVHRAAATGADNPGSAYELGRGRTAVVVNAAGPDRTRRVLDKTGNVPPAAMLAAFQMIRPSAMPSHTLLCRPLA